MILIIGMDVEFLKIKIHEVPRHLLILILLILIQIIQVKSEIFFKRGFLFGKIILKIIT